MCCPKIAICSSSLGKSLAGHDINRKIEVAKAHGYDGIEVAFECLDIHSQNLVEAKNLGREERLRTGAKSVYEKASSLSLPLIALNPFGFYDGLKNPEDIEIRLKEAELWCQLCQIMKIPIFQIPSCMYPIEESKITPDPKKIAQNMRRLGLLAQKYNLTVAYEAPAWGTHIDTWEQIHEIITLVNLPNVTHCLDTYHISARMAGDPFNAISPVRTGGMVALQASLQKMKNTLLPSEIGYLQLSDATVADREQKGYPNRDTAQPIFMTQSRNCRIYPCEKTIYHGTLPALDVAKAVFELGYRGWVSMEVFNVDLWDTRPSVPEEWAIRGMDSWHRIVVECHLNDINSPVSKL